MEGSKKFQKMGQFATLKILFKLFFIFQGHGVSLSTAITIVTKSMNGPQRRLPEPIFAADLLSRKSVAEMLNQDQKWKNFVNNNQELTLKEKQFWIQNFK